MAKQQTAQSMGFPMAGSKGDSRPVVRRRHQGGGSPKQYGQDVTKPTTSSDAHKSSVTPDVRKRKNEQ